MRARAKPGAVQESSFDGKKAGKRGVVNGKFAGAENKLHACHMIVGQRGRPEFRRPEFRKEEWAAGGAVRTWQHSCGLGLHMGGGLDSFSAVVAALTGIAEGNPEKIEPQIQRIDADY